MTQPIRLSSLRPAASAGFEQPFDMLQACHERVQRMLALLHRLRDHQREHGCDEQARQAARDVMRYFDLAAPEHHRDEELHVFPPLLAQGDVATTQLVRRLQHEHLQMESLWQAARQVLDAVSNGSMNQLEPQDEATLDAFASIYADHIEAEEKIAYPAAQARLSPQALAAMSEEMMRRRGVR